MKFYPIGLTINGHKVYAESPEAAKSVKDKIMALEDRAKGGVDLSKIFGKLH